MWQAIERVLTSPNGAAILIFLAFVIVVVLLLSKNGLLQIHTQNIQFGAATKEREIIMQQVMWVTLHFEAMERTIKKPEGYSEWRGKYIVEKIIDEYVNWILYNHINLSDVYVSIKQDKIVNIVRKYVILDEFRTEEFEQMLRTDVVNCIKQLIKIREFYLKGE